MDNSRESLDTSVLRSAPIFAPLPDWVVRKVIERGEIRHCDEGSVLFSPGDPSNEVFVVVSGVIEICRPDPDVGELSVVTYAGEGDAVGEMVLFTGSPRSSYARIPEEAEIFAISRPALIELCREEPDLALYFCQMFASRLESWMKKGRRQETQRQLQGNLKFFDLATVLQTLGGSEHSGVLAIADEVGQSYADLEFKEGKLAFARLGHLTGEQALFQLFQATPNGSFLFQGRQSMDGNTGPRVDKDVVGLLLEAMRLHDELKVLREKYTDAHRIYQPCAQDLVWDDDETFLAAFGVWACLHRIAPISQLLAELPYSEAVVLAVLDRLVETGQVY
jgi:hypothetical protein